MRSKRGKEVFEIYVIALTNTGESILSEMS